MQLKCVRTTLVCHPLFIQAYAPTATPAKAIDFSPPKAATVLPSAPTRLFEC